MSIDLKFVELTADVLEIFLIKCPCSGHIRLADLGLAKVLKSTVDRTNRCHFVCLLWEYFAYFHSPRKQNVVMAST